MTPLFGSTGLISWGPEEFEQLTSLEKSIETLLEQIRDLRAEDPGTNFPNLFKYALDEALVFKEEKNDFYNARNLFIVLSDMKPVPNSLARQEIIESKTVWLDPSTNSNKAEFIEIEFIAIDSGRADYPALMEEWRASFSSQFSERKIASFHAVTAPEAYSSEFAQRLLTPALAILDETEIIEMPTNLSNLEIVLLKPSPFAGSLKTDDEYDTLRKIASSLHINPLHLIGLNEELKIPNEEDALMLDRVLPKGTKISFPHVSLDGARPDQTGHSLKSSSNGYFEVWQLDTSEATLELVTILPDDGNIFWFFRGVANDYKVSYNSLFLSTSGSLIITLDSPTIPQIGDEVIVSFKEREDYVGMGVLEWREEFDLFIGSFPIRSENYELDPGHITVRIVYRNASGDEDAPYYCSIEIIEPPTLIAQDVLAYPNRSTTIETHVDFDYGFPPYLISLKAEYYSDPGLEPTIVDFQLVESSRSTRELTFKGDLKCSLFPNDGKLIYLLGFTYKNSWYSDVRPYVNVSCNCSNVSQFEKIAPFVLLATVLSIIVVKKNNLPSVNFPLFVINSASLFGLVFYVFDPLTAFTFVTGLAGLISPFLSAILQRVNVVSYLEGQFREMKYLYYQMLLFALTMILILTAVFTCKFGSIF